MKPIRELVRAHLLYAKMVRYPNLLDEMRQLFLQALEERGVIDGGRLEREALALAREEEDPPSEEVAARYRNALIDYYFAIHFSDAEIEGYINLARKHDRFRNLNRVLNAEGVTAKQIRRALKEFCEIPQGDLYILPSEAEGVRVALINHFISNQLPFIGIAKHHITIRDVDEMLDHTFWSSRRSGKIGGKAAGMFLAYKILLPRLQERDPELETYLTIPESYYFNSGIFSDFVDYNGFFQCYTQKYKSREAIEKEYENIWKLFEKATFPPDLVQRFRRFLKKIGEHPLILRSSSFLEDNFGIAFSGKYDSVFLANQGDLEARLEQFIRGLKRVHLSTYGPAPILYRRERNLLDFDEKMGVLVQKVVGRRFGDYFFPLAAGVAYSYNTYRWTPRIRRQDGLVRLVFGLGTRAVDRVGQDYPRMVALSHPQLRPEMEAGKIIKYSQKMVDALNLKTGELETLAYREALRLVPPEDRFLAVSIHQEGHLAAPLFKTQEIPPNECCITFDNLLSKTPFVHVMRKSLKRLEKAYGRPVDVEFAWDRNRLYLLQCRTLPTVDEPQHVEIPEDVPEDSILFSNRTVVVNSIVRDVEYVVYVDPKGYAELTSYEEKLAVGRIVGRLNTLLQGKRYGLFGPGRWGSNDINLGVRVGYQDINHTLILAEVAFERDGVTPEVSFGTHFFNDLVEGRIVPVAIFPDQKGVFFNERFFTESPSRLEHWLPEYGDYRSVVKVIHVPVVADGRLLQVYQDGETQRGVGFLERPARNNHPSAPVC